MKPLGKALPLGILTAAFLFPVLPATADETESMMNGAPNADATLRDKNAMPGAPVENADPGMVKPPPKHDKKMVEKPPDPAMDPGIHLPGTTPPATATPRE